MAHKTLKRLHEELSSDKDDLNDDDYDVTWGGKRSRYLYNYVLQSPDSLSDSDNSDLTESSFSVQSKSTIEAVNESDLSSDQSSGSNFHYENDSDSIVLTEFEVVSSSSCSYINRSNSSDSSSVVDLEVPKNSTVRDKTLNSSDYGYLPDDTDTQVTKVPKLTLPPPACFITCVQCRRENPNPYFQYCYTCFRYRMENFDSKPNIKPKNLQRLYRLRHEKEEKSITLPQESDKSTAKNFENTENLCNICFRLPKNGVFNHGRIGHIYSCYPCAKKLWRKSNKCPICNVKVKFVTKMITV